MTPSTAVVILALIGSATQPSVLATAQTCDVTVPNHHATPVGSEPLPPGMAAQWHGNASVGTALWPEGKVVFKPGGPGTILSDGALRMKFFWLKAPGARLTVSAHRFDDPSVKLRSEINHDLFDGQGMQPSYLIFPTPGCWQIEATTGGETLSFVTSVVRIDKGPSDLR